MNLASCHERFDPIQVAGLLPSLPLQVPLQVELGRQAVCTGGLKGSPCKGNPDRWLLGEALGRGPCRGDEFAIRANLPDQAPCGRLFGGNGLGEERDRLRSGRADEARDEPGAAAIGDEADIGEDLQEARRLRGNDDVAGERNIGPGPGRHTIDGSDHRAAEAAQAAHQRVVVALETVAEIGSRVVGANTIREVLASAETPACTREDNRSASVVRFRRVKRRAESLMHRDVEGVEARGPVQRNDVIAFRPFCKDGCGITLAWLPVVVRHSGS